MDDFDKRMGCPKLYAGITAWVGKKVPESYVADVVHEIYKVAQGKREEAPTAPEMMLAWLKAFGRRIVPRFMKKVRREPLVEDVVCEALPHQDNEDVEKINRLNALEPRTEGERRAIEDAKHLLAHGGSLAERAQETGESSKAVSNRAWKYAPRIAALLAGSTLLLLTLAIVMAIAMRPKKQPDEVRPDEAPTAPATTVPNPAMSTPVQPENAPDAKWLLEKAIDMCNMAPGSNECFSALVDAQDADIDVVKDPRFKKARAPFDVSDKPPAPPLKPPAPR
ncbi:MAG TPA: hypothetical protein VMV18_13445 [bacterium]|nr:hypothetical protein [bacterium]